MQSFRFDFKTRDGETYSIEFQASTLEQAKVLSRLIEDATQFNPEPFDPDDTEPLIDLDGWDGWDGWDGPA